MIIEIREQLKQLQKSLKNPGLNGSLTHELVIAVSTAILVKMLPSQLQLVRSDFILYPVRGKFIVTFYI